LETPFNKKVHSAGNGRSFYQPRLPGAQWRFGSVGNGKWAGVRFRDLMDAARPYPSATVYTFVSSEVPYVDTLTVQQSGLSDAMLAYEMDGKPLAREHGAPVRVVIPEMYGYKNVMWVERIVVGDKLEPGYWEQRGYDVNAWVGHSNGL